MAGAKPPALLVASTFLSITRVTCKPKFKKQGYGIAAPLLCCHWKASPMPLKGGSLAQEKQEILVSPSFPPPEKERQPSPAQHLPSDFGSFGRVRSAWRMSGSKPNMGRLALWTKPISHHEMKPWLKRLFVGIYWHLQGNHHSTGCRISTIHSMHPLSLQCTLASPARSWHATPMRYKGMLPL